MSVMKTVFKYEMPIDDTAVIMMREGAEILHFGAQYDKPMMWALVPADPNHPVEPRTFRSAGTGHPIAAEDRPRYIGTAHLMRGTFVLHLFALHLFEIHRPQ